jgi:hypothetical protein
MNHTKTGGELRRSEINTDIQQNSSSAAVRHNFIDIQKLIQKFDM